jgi:hypothetical protein
MRGMRRHLAWPIALPLALVGTLAGHSLGYRAAVPDEAAREHLLASSGHGYLQYTPLFVGLATAAVVLGFLAMVARSFLDRGGARSTHVKLIAAIPPLAFVLQELVERFLHAGHVDWHMLLSGPFVLGLLAQIPFALLAAAIAYALGTIAARLGAALAARRPRPLRRRVALPFGSSADLPLRPALARGYAGRGPPLVA